MKRKQNFPKYNLIKFNKLLLVLWEYQTSSVLLTTVLTGNGFQLKNKPLSVQNSKSKYKQVPADSVVVCKRRTCFTYWGGAKGKNIMGTVKLFKKDKFKKCCEEKLFRLHFS